EVGQAGESRSARCPRCFVGGATGDGTPPRTGRPVGWDRDQGLRQGSLQESTGGRSHDMPSGEANELTPCHTRSRVRGHGKVFHGDRGARGSEVPLLQRS
ncbi:unnamed protein product, partial [Laminaria digitata]